MKAAIYSRISTQDQNLDKQISICQEFCNSKGFEIVDTYKDVISGSKESRPELNRLLEDMRHYKFRIIVTTKLDRIGRSLKHILSLFDEFKAKGVEFAAVTQNIDTSSPAGRFQMQMLGAFAEFERELIRERTREGLKKAKNVGKRGKDKKPRKKRGALRKASF